MTTEYRAWTMAEVIRARDLRANGKRPWQIVGQILDRHPENCRKRVAMLNAGRHPTGKASRAAVPGPDAVVCNDAAHIRACLQAGGFGRLPLAWAPPIKRSWAA